MDKQRMLKCNGRPENNSKKNKSDIRQINQINLYINSPHYPWGPRAKFRSQYTPAYRPSASLHSCLSGCASPHRKVQSSHCFHTKAYRPPIIREIVWPT